jgi:chromosome partitioning protein
MSQNSQQINQPREAIPKSAPAGPILIVFGNEKGGSGKSTAALQTAIALLYRGFRVGTIDLDARQGTMTRYLRNRYLFSARTPLAKTLPCPLHLPIDRSRAVTEAEQKAEDMSFLAMAMDELGNSCDYIVVDTPGADTHLNRLAHGLADTLITPMNDSLVDLDVLATIDPLTQAVIGPSFYTRHVHELLSAKAAQLGRPTRWFVMRNRLSALDNNNKRTIDIILTRMAATHGFQVLGGFGERLIYRDLFLQGLTASDLAAGVINAPLTASQQAAVQETNGLIAAILGPDA